MINTICIKVSVWKGVQDLWASICTDDMKEILRTKEKENMFMEEKDIEIDVDIKSQEF